MNIHKKLVVMVGLGMALLLTITIFSLQSITAAFSRTTAEVGQTALEFQRIWDIEKKIDAMSLSAHSYIETGGRRSRQDYEATQAALHAELDALTKLQLTRQERDIFTSLLRDLRETERKTARIFSLPSPLGSDRVLALEILFEVDDLHTWMGRDMARLQENHASQMGTIAEQLSDTKLRIDFLFVVIIIASASLLFVFSLYVYSKVSAPLADLWKGTGEISRGNLDYRIQVHGASDIGLLAERFNDMAQRLKRSYSELEDKLLDRTRELAAIDSVALTLSTSGTINDMLKRSLLKILESLSGLEPQGGVFLCDPNGEALRLTVHHGLPPEFVQKEATIRMGECLCGLVAQTGELLLSDQGCEDPRHTRSRGAGPHSHIIIPIKTRGIVLGVIFLYPGQHFSLKPSDIQMLDAIGAQVGMAIENLRFYSEVKASSEKFWDLFENSRDILFTMDSSGRLTAVNKAAEEFSGYPKIELIGKDIQEFLTTGGAEAVRAMLDNGSIAQQHLAELDVIKRDNTHAFLELSIRRLFNGQLLTGYQVSARDITEQRQLRARVLQTERLGAIGQVIVTVRHEINNPLTTVIGNAELLLERYEGKDKELEKRLDTILNNSLRIAEIVTRLKEIKQDKVVEYVEGVKMTDLKQEKP